MLIHLKRCVSSVHWKNWGKYDNMSSGFIVIFQSHNELSCSTLTDPYCIKLL